MSLKYISLASQEVAVAIWLTLARYINKSCVGLLESVLKREECVFFFPTSSPAPFLIIWNKDMMVGAPAATLGDLENGSFKLMMVDPKHRILGTWWYMQFL